MSKSRFSRALLIGPLTGVVAVAGWMVGLEILDGQLVRGGYFFESVLDSTLVLAVMGAFCGLPGGLYLGLRRKAVLDWGLSASLICALIWAAVALALSWDRTMPGTPIAWLVVGVAGLLVGFAAAGRPDPPQAGIRGPARPAATARLLLLIVLSLTCLLGGVWRYPRYSQLDKPLLAAGFVGLSAAWILTGHERRIRMLESHSIGTR